MSPFKLCRLYLAIKLHFDTTKYSCIKYNFKVKYTEEQFEKRRDIMFFKSLYRKDYIKTDAVNFMIANYLNDPEGFAWIGNLLKPDAESIYLEYIKRRDSMSYTFTKEVEKFSEPLDLMVKVKSGQFPTLLVKYFHGEIGIDTIIIINKICNILPYWDNNITDALVYPTYRKKFEKYQEIFDIIDLDKTKYKKILAKQHKHIQRENTNDTEYKPQEFKVSS